MSKKDEIKKQADAAADDVKEAADAVKDAAEDGKVSAKEALAEIADDLAADDAAEDTGKDAKKKRKKRERTPKEEQERALNAVKRRKKFKYGALATAITLVVIAIVVVVNVICNVLDSRYNWNIDLTSSGLYQIDDKTVEYLHQLNSDIEISVMADESYFLDNSMLKVVDETLNRFKAESNGHISVGYYDLTKNPDIANSVKGDYSGELTLGDVVVKSGDLVRVVPFDEIIKTTQEMDYQTYSYNQKYSFIGEQSLVSALMGVTDLHPVKVAVINKTNGNALYTSQDEGCMEMLKNLLDKNNYNVTEVDIATDSLTDEYDLAILCAPYNDLSEAQLAKITDYLNNGGTYGKDLIYLGSPYQQLTLPNVDAFLELWGLKVGPAIMYDSNDATAQRVQTFLSYLSNVGAISEIPAVKATDDELNAGFTGSTLPVVAPLCRPVEVLFEANSGRAVAPLLTTTDTCYLFPLGESSDEFDKDAAEKSAFNVAAYSTTTFTSGSETYSGRVVAFGSAWFLDYVVGSSAAAYDNADYFVKMLNTLTGKESVLTIAEKSLDTTKITVTEAQGKAIRTVTVFCIPLAVALIGIIVYVRRRNR
ncbi:MAG TPA: hypothetical protein DDX71_05960 [Ruminococcus sp.]|nr:hypothetical protein [Ruminococcus sp.]